MKKWFQKLRYKLACLIAGDSYVLTKWVRVEDELPDSYTDVLVAIRYENDPLPYGQSEVSASYLDDRLIWRTADILGDPIAPKFSHRTVTHWMSRPEPPKED